MDEQLPLIVQSDLTLLLEVQSSLFQETRKAIAPFAEIVKSPEYIHTYQITDLSLWNAASSGISSQGVTERLQRFAKFPVSKAILEKVQDTMSRFGSVEIHPNGGELLLKARDAALMELIRLRKPIAQFFQKDLDPVTTSIRATDRGLVKQALIREGYPALDFAGYSGGEKLSQPVMFREDGLLRDYQRMACDAFCDSGSKIGGSGVIVLPCGAGKTIVGMAVLTRMNTHTLILTTGTTSVHQWKQELIRKTTLEEGDIGEYSGEQKQIRPVTISTYQMLTSRRGQNSEFLHFDIFNACPWGLIIYDEVHLLPAQVFQFSASVQAVRRLGLTATLIREDRRETDVFSLIGPKCFDIPWREIERQGWIAQTKCTEIRVPLLEQTKMDYARAEKRERFRIAAENSMKQKVISELLQTHEKDSILIIGQYVEQIQLIANSFEIPCIHGKTPQHQRDAIYDRFRKGLEKRIVVSSVANFALDLPNATVAIQVSGKFGSRQEEAQRLGRILRPKEDGRMAHFYTLVSEGTDEQEFAFKRQLFLIEQGYEYEMRYHGNIR